MGGGSRNRLLIAATFVLIYFAGAVVIPAFNSIPVQLYLLGDLGITLLVSCGMLYMLIMNGLDLSVGATAGICSVAGAVLIQQGYPLWSAFFLVLIIGALIGTVNFVQIWFLRIHPFVATTLMMFVLRGVGLLIKQPNFDLVHPEIVQVARYSNQPQLLFLSPLWWLPLTALVVSWLIFRFTALPGAFLSAGRDRVTMRRIGMSAAACYWVAALSSSISASAAGWLYILSTASGHLSYGGRLEIEVITAAALSGFLFTRGRGEVLMLPVAAMTLSVLYIISVESGSSSVLNYNAMAALLMLVVYLVRDSRDDF